MWIRYVLYQIFQKTMIFIFLCIGEAFTPLNNITKTPLSVWLFGDIKVKILSRETGEQLASKDFFDSSIELNYLTTVLGKCYQIEIQYFPRLRSSNHIVKQELAEGARRNNL